MAFIYVTINVNVVECLLSIESLLHQNIRFVCTFPVHNILKRQLLFQAKKVLHVFILNLLQNWTADFSLHWYFESPGENMEGSLSQGICSKKNSVALVGI